MTERAWTGIRVGLVIVLAALGFVRSAETHEAASARGGAVHALLINGGGQPSSNYLSHLQHLQGMVDLLGQRGVAPERIHVFSADGEDSAADLATRDRPPAGFWLIEDTSVGRKLRPTVQIVNTPWRAVRLRPARLDALRQWFDSEGQAIVPGDRLLVFVTDHGGPARNGAGTGTISLWREQLTVRDFHALLDRLPSQVQVVTVMSQCYSGAFADLMYDRGHGEPSGARCGFFATSADNKAFGCYPESRDEDRIGYAFEMIDALARQTTVGQAHERALWSDNTPDMPRRTSDEYLSHLVSREAKSRGIDADALADSLLAAVRKRSAEWEPEIRLLDAIGNAFGMASPRSLAELKPVEKDLATRAEQLRTYADRWKAALASFGESLLSAFLAAHPEWRPSLEPQTIDKLTPTERMALLEKLLDGLQPFARQSDIWTKLEQFRDAFSSGSAASWRFEVRKSAAERMRTILVAVAGRALLREIDDRHRDAFDALVRCEALEPGGLSSSSRVTPAATRGSFPSRDDDIALLYRIQPSWLGVRYGAVPPALRQRVPSLTGASQIQAVEENSPAAEAGIEVGDVIVGPPERPFKSAQDFRNWTTTSPSGSPMALKVYRPASESRSDREFEVAVSLRPYPIDQLIVGAAAPAVGSPAPALPATLKSGRGRELPDLRGRSHLLFFWATWCSICKAALPETMAFAAARGIPVLAITDEDQATVSKFLDGWTAPFFEWVAIDSVRKTFLAHAVSGTPTFVLVDEEGVVRYRQVGYRAADGLKLEGWSRAR